MLIEDLITRANLPIRPSHPCLYDALYMIAEIRAPKSYLEIGVHDGASLLTVLAAAPSLTRIVLCDLVNEIGPLLAQMNYRGAYDFLLGDSFDLIPSLPADAPFDLILIDGDHSSLYACADLRNSYPLLRPGGVLLIDDSSRAEVAEACKLAEETYKLTRLAHFTDHMDSVTLYEKLRLA